MIFLSLVHLLFLFRGICGEADPNPNPNPNPDPRNYWLIPPPTPEPSSQPEPEFWRQINNVETKEVNNDQMKSERSLFQSVLSAVTGEANTNNSDIPEMVFQDQPYSGEQSVQPGQGESVQKVYNLQPITRLIATSEVEPEKKGQIWRSPLPFIHPDDCPHHRSNKKSRSSKKKGRKQRKSEPKPKPTPKPVTELSDNTFGSLLSSVLSHAMSSPVFEPEPLRPEPIRLESKSPSSFLMSITHRSEPQVLDVPPPPQTRPMFMALIRKRMDPMPEPEPVMSELLPPLNPFLAFLSKLGPMSEPKMSVKESEDEEKNKEQLNFNFNVNFTINNHNYPQPENKFLRSELPLPFLFK